MLIRDIMQTKIITVNLDCEISEIVKIFYNHRIDSVPVVREEKLVGLFTKSHLLKLLKEGASLSLPVKEVMERHIHTVKQDLPLVNLKEYIFSTGVTRFPVVDDDMNLIGIVTKTDILRASSFFALTLNNEMEVLLNSTHNGVIAVDHTEKITVINDAAAKIFNISSKEWIGKHICDLLPTSALPEVLKTGCSQIGVRLQIGDVVLFTNRTPIIFEDKIVGAIAVFEDVTALEKVIEELEVVKELKEILSLIVENPYEGTVIIDELGKIKMTNEAFCNFLNVSKEEAIGKFINEVLPESRLMEVLRTGQPQFAEMIKIKGHDMIVMRVPIINNGKITGAIGKTLFTEFHVANEFTRKIKELENELNIVKQELKEERNAKYTFENIIGNSEKIKNLIRKATKAAQTSSTILLIGESGTGKELLAHSIHNASSRRDEPFVRVNCASVPDTLLESELFGYEEGAFTGARRGGKPGKFEIANKGTIFLDEIADMPLSMQAKLLRVLQEREIERIGGSRPKEIDVRVIAATNRDLEQMVQNGEFREDLYYRLNVVNLTLPPLRERRDDILLLAEYLIKKLNKELGTGIVGLTADAKKLLYGYHWPGNIRQLQNVLEQAINLTDSPFLSSEDFPLIVKKLGKKRDFETLEIRPLNEALDEAERSLLVSALKFTGNNKVQTAKLLQIHRSVLYRKLVYHGLLNDDI